ncbi:MAG TPA: IPT/TIG domain-containing protein, partial [bacterium]|nr:IPT/TIG domain-containing protein [bacterium]
APSTVGSVPITVEVSNKEGKATGVASVLVSVSPTGPIITGVNPAEAKTGMEIEITGAGFGSRQGGSSVVIGGAAASSILSWSDTEIRAVVPADASNRVVKVVVGGVESSPGALVLLWEKENPENVAISTAAGEQISPRLTSDGAGGAIIAWADFRNGATADIYAQRVNGSGVVQWAADGISLSTAANNQTFPQLISDGSGGAIVVWEDNRTGSADIYAQRVNHDGTAAWTIDGIPISAAANSQLSPQLVSDGSGGAIIVWQDHRNGTTDLYAQRVNGAGSLQWSADGVAVTTAPSAQQSAALVSDGAGGAIIVWQDHRAGTNSDIYAQRIGADGVVQWGADGLAISTAAGNQQFPQLVSDGAGGAIAFWQDRRSGTDKIYAQRVNGAGALQWSAGSVPLSTTANSQTSPQLIPDGAGGAIVVWQDGTDIDAQRVNGAGAVQWSADGVALSTASDIQSFPQIIPDGSGGAIVAWSDRRNGADYDLYTQRVNSAGVIQWTAEGIPLSTAPHDQSSGGATSPPEIIADGSGGAIVVWQDQRSGTTRDIYAQGISASGRE